MSAVETTVDSALADTDPVGFVAAVADLRKTRAKAATTEGSASPWRAAEDAGCGCCANIRGGAQDTLLANADDRYAEHIAAEANPAHALAEVALWRSIVADMEREAYRFTGDIPYTWTYAVAAARAYLGGST